MPDLVAPKLEEQKAASLLNVLEAILAPYHETESSRIQLRGSDVSIGVASLPGIALLLHEYSTNAAKYGALTTPLGHLVVDLVLNDGMLQMTWAETGGPPANGTGTEGFGTVLERATVKNQLGGSVEREWSEDGLTIRLSIPLSRLEA